MKNYKPKITATINRKGVLDVDTVKGCSFGMKKYGAGGCYGLCYAAKMAKLYGYDFSESVSREMDTNKKQLKLFDGLCLGGPSMVFNMVKGHSLPWFRVGVMGDPCHDWKLTADVCGWLGMVSVPVIVTKHWLKIPPELFKKFGSVGTVFNTSISALDTVGEIKIRLKEYKRLKKAGLRSVLRVVSCCFGDTEQGHGFKKVQERLFDNDCVIDNPLRIPPTDTRVKAGHILVEKRQDLKSETSISMFNKTTYIGHCGNCPDQCGVL